MGPRARYRGAQDHPRVIWGSSGGPLGSSGDHLDHLGSPGVIWGSSGSHLDTSRSMCARCHKNHEIHARTWAAGYFHDSMFFAYFDSPKSYVLLSDGAGDVTEYHVLRRQRSQVFLAHVLRSERTGAAVRSSKGYVLRSQVNGICAGERRRTLRNARTEACQRT